MSDSDVRNGWRAMQRSGLAGLGYADLVTLCSLALSERARRHAGDGPFPVTVRSSFAHDVTAADVIESESNTWIVHPGSVAW